MRYKIALLLCSVFVSKLSCAFDGKRCLNVMGQGQGWGMVVSATSFVSSTGDCSAIAMNNEERAQRFYAFNHEKVLEDIAKGGGEYYSSLSSLWNCKDKNVMAARGNYAAIIRLDTVKQYAALKKLITCGKDENKI